MLPWSWDQVIHLLTLFRFWSQSLSAGWSWWVHCLKQALSISCFTLLIMISGETQASTLFFVSSWCVKKSLDGCYVSLTPTWGEVADPPSIQSLGVPPVQSALSAATLERPQSISYTTWPSHMLIPTWRMVKFLVISPNICRVAGRLPLSSFTSSMLCPGLARRAFSCDSSLPRMHEPTNQNPGIKGTAMEQQLLHWNPLWVQYDKKLPSKGNHWNHK